MLPKALQELISELSALPGVGPRTAERYAYYLLRSSQPAAARLSRAIDRLHDNVKFCPVTFALIDAHQSISPLYSDPARDKRQIAVVEDALDVIALERTGAFKGTYHVLGGIISPIDGIGPEKLHIPELLDRIKRDQATEVILALNARVEGESTALFIQKQIEGSGLKVAISRLARGLPMGVDLEFADQITLSHALAGRREL